ncbi:MAG: alpha/beta fold hydrolase [Deltaproteobacteria bacterium]|nr:alpha/beta fold hydrolase [Deltaproteobacteria bacterium]
MHAKLNGVRLHYRIEGQGRPVLLLHPVGLDLTWWDSQAGALRLEFQVIRLDFRGHGKSEIPPPPWSIAEFASDAHALLALLHSRPAHVVGLSLGGMVAQVLALEYPADVRSLVLADTLCTLPAEARNAMRARGEAAEQGGMAAVIQPTVERWFTPGFLESPVVARCRAHLLANDVKPWAETWRAIAELDTLPRLNEIHTPTLVTTGDADVSTPVAAARVIADHIPGAILRVMPGAPHMAPYERPDLFNPLVLEFLRSLSA